MAKRALSPHDRGMRSAYLMLAQLERGLHSECDPGYDEGSYGRPLRNILFERVSALAADQEELKGFCLALGGFLAIVAAGSCPTAKQLRKEFDERFAWDRRVAAARADPAIQRLLQEA